MAEESSGSSMRTAQPGYFLSDLMEPKRSAESVNLEEVATLLCCPDDEGALSLTYGGLRCDTCERHFPVHGGNLVEMLPKTPWELTPSVSSEYQESYAKAFHQKYYDDPRSLAWAAEERVPRTWSLMRRRQVEFVRPLITQGNRRGHAVLCDVSAGAGYYTLAYADLFRMTLHCDLSVDNLSYARRKAHSLGIRNIFFVRMDYFTPPFRNSLDCLLCMDTLIHGEAHESRLLATITNSLSADGFAIVDFHNWWHNPLRRLGLMPNNFGENRSYTKREIKQILESGRIARYGCFRFHQELNDSGVGQHVLQRMLPATRFLVRIHGSNSSDLTWARETRR